WNIFIHLRKSSDRFLYRRPHIDLFFIVRPLLLVLLKFIDGPLLEPEMGWPSYVAPVLGSAFISTLAFLLGALGYSYIWIGLITALNVTKNYLWKKREKRLMALRATATREREVVMAQLQDLPAWVQFPDTERVEWLNKVCINIIMAAYLSGNPPTLAIYRRVCEIFHNGLRYPSDKVILLKAQMPGVFKNFKFTKMDMGDIPCRVGGIKVYTKNVGKDRIIVDMDVAYAGDADFTVSCCGFTGGMNNLQFSGKLRAVLKPLLPYPPMIGGVAGSFLEMPKIDFNLTGMGEMVELPGLMNAIRSVVNSQKIDFNLTGMGEMVELPGLMNAIRSVVNSQVAALCVLPNEIIVPLAPNVDVTKLFLPEPDGVIRLKVIEAKNLENRDISFIRKGKSDPYCEIQVGSQFLKTRTIDNDLNPVWNEYFEAVVDQAHGQKLRIELFDEDQGRDEELGRLSIDLKDIQNRGRIESWFPLEGCKHGDLHLKATWMNLSKDRRHLEKQQWESEWLQADKPIHPALLMVFVDSVADLPYPKSKLEPSPFIEVTLGMNSQRTPVKVKTVNPLYQSKFLFFVRHPEGQELKFEVSDQYFFCYFPNKLTRGDYPKSKLEPSPFIEVTLGMNSQRTPVKVKTVNPLYQSKFLFFVRHPEGQELKFEAFDDGTQRSLGSFTLPLNLLINEPDLQYYQQTFMLTLGVHQSPIVLTVKLRNSIP
ncbi:C2 domain protein, partial [Dictyocaulus viviparus]